MHPNPEYRDSTLLGSAYTAVACPRCQVPAGQWCRSKGRSGGVGYQDSAVRHTARHALVASWDDAKRLTESAKHGVYHRPPGPSTGDGDA